MSRMKFQRAGSVARWKRQSPRSTRPGTRAQTTMPACAKRASTGALPRRVDRMDQRGRLARADDVLERHQRLEHALVAGIDVEWIAADLQPPVGLGRLVGRIGRQCAEMGERAAQAALGDAQGLRRHRGAAASSVPRATIPQRSAAAFSARVSRAPSKTQL